MRTSSSARRTRSGSSATSSTARWRPASTALLERVRPRHPDDHTAELPVGIDVEEVAVVHVVLRAVVQLADVALLCRDLPGLRLDDDVLDLVEDRDRAVAEVGEHPADLLRPFPGRVRGLHRHHAVVGEVREDRVDVLGIDCLEVAVRQGRELVAGQRMGLGGHDPSSSWMSDIGESTLPGPTRPADPGTPRSRPRICWRLVLRTERRADLLVAAARDGAGPLLARQVPPGDATGVVLPGANRRRPDDATSVVEDDDEVP